MFILADEAGGGTANSAPEVPASESAEGLPADNPNGEGTTPEEVASVLKSSGINLPAEPKAAAADDEEGDDPDAIVADAGEEDAAGEGTDTEEVANEEPVKPATEDDGKPAPTDEEVQAAADARVATADDKYSFEVEDANGVTFKVPVGAKMEDVLKEFEPKNNGQILDILDQLRDMKAQKAADDATEAENTSKAEQAQRVSEIRKAWDGEVTDLTAQKRIPEGTEGEDRVKEVYKFMAEENGKRMEAGRPTIGSFEDALDKLEAKEGREAKVAADKAAKDDARKNGGLVGGSSAPATGSSPVYRAGTARNANEAIRAMGLIK